METESYFEKGITSVFFRKYLINTVGQEPFRRLLEKLSLQARDMIEAPDPNRWYPVTLMRELYDTVYDVFGKEYPEILFNMGRFVSDESARGFLRYLTRLFSVTTLINRIGAFWKHYHRGGGIEAGESGRIDEKKQGFVTVYGYPTGQHGRTAMQGYIEAILERAGARSLKIERNPEKDNSDDTFSWLLSWE